MPIPQRDSTRQARIRHGETRLSRAMLNDVLAKVVQMIRGVDGIIVRQAGTNITISQRRQARGGTATDAVRMKVTDVSQNNYIVCQTWNGTTQGTTDINVAKAPQLRHLAENYHYYLTSSTTAALSALVTVAPQEVTITLQDGITTETWRVNHPYFIGAEIYPVRVEGGTGVNDCNWIDLDSNRKWGRTR